MDGQGGRRKSGRWPVGRSTRARNDPSARLSIGRLLVVCGALALAVVMTQRMLSPLAVGWRRGEELLAGEERLMALEHQAKVLEEEIAFSKTNSGRTLEAFEQKGVVERGGRVVKAVAKQPSPAVAPPMTLARRAKAWREDAQAYLGRKWRVVALCVFGKRLSAPSDA